MIQLVPHMKILLAIAPVDFRKGADTLAALCKEQLSQDPYSGTLFVFRNRSGTALNLLIYDGVGFWLFWRRFSQGKLRWWPQAADDAAHLHSLAAQQLSALLYNANPMEMKFAPDWKMIAQPQAASLSGAPRA